MLSARDSTVNASNQPEKINVGYIKVVQISQEEVYYKEEPPRSSAGTWFAALSPAVQRKLFSKEECSFYNGNTNSGILDAAEQTLRRRSWHTSRLLLTQRRISDDETIVDWEDIQWEDIKCEDKTASTLTCLVRSPFLSQPYTELAELVKGQLKQCFPRDILDLALAKLATGVRENPCQRPWLALCRWGFRYLNSRT